MATWAESFKAIEDLRWKLTEKKYMVGLTVDEHDHLLMLAAYCWKNRR